MMKSRKTKSKRVCVDVRYMYGEAEAEEAEMKRRYGCTRSVSHPVNRETLLAGVGHVVQCGTRNAHHEAHALQCGTETTIGCYD
ncbi:predicted protein [Pyrenophora tritici-repentis Pt-1C-BFP]|uniref:Uncharacterized protein n=1 Tax=Pyrenophora tritici-repentis (strain Pt-1C-BFP) TaxID=426418 RepID=B2W6H7_PYRTR|nr:uncharacterized protein PTRG_05415 [Pyrenophora tritici-repentis Pt-1C-BFP]EDU48335.1 predicted protein [Pyrenophora tritici-repentis Pt-1C-BFP]